MKGIHLIRHGMTEGNRMRRYIGRTDEPLCPEGIKQARALAGLPAFDRIFASPYRRCLETARILFPGADIAKIRDLRECDFGIFEGRTAAEMEKDAAYNAWVASGCTAPIPGGERVEDFKARCRAAFLRAAGEVPEGGSLAFVIHGGCIMAILEACAVPRRAFYDYHIENCGFVRCALHRDAITIEGGSACF